MFLDTWMAGGLGRAQGGYDEMVFRSMVQDGAPLLRSARPRRRKAPKIDFQVRGQLVSVRHAVHDVAGAHAIRPETADRVGRRATTAAGPTTRRNSSSVFGMSLERRWAVDRRRARRSSRRTSTPIRAVPDDAVADLTTQALGSVSRAFYDAARQTIYAAFNYPGVVAHVGAIAADTGSVERLADIKGPSIYTVTSLACDPERATLFYTADNGAYRDLMALDPATQRTAHADEGRADRRPRVRPRRPVALGHPSAERHLHPRPDPARRTRDWDACHTLPYGTILYDLDVSPDGRGSRPRSARSAASRTCACSTDRRRSRRRRDAGRAVRLRHRGAERLRVLAGWPRISTAARTSPASRTSSATTSRRGSSRR